MKYETTLNGVRVLLIVENDSKVIHPTKGAFDVSELREALKDLLDSHFDMSPLEYAQSRGLSFMSDEEGEKIVSRCRVALNNANLAEFYDPGSD